MRHSGKPRQAQRLYMVLQTYAKTGNPREQSKFIGVVGADQLETHHADQIQGGVKGNDRNI